MVAAELAIARRRGTFRKICCNGTQIAPPPMPSSPPTKPAGKPTAMTAQGFAGRFVSSGLSGFAGRNMRTALYTAT